MSDSSQTLPPTSGSVDVELLGGGTERQRIQVTGALLAEVARVLNTAPVGTEYALATRTVAGDVSVALTALAAPNAAAAVALAGKNGSSMEFQGGGTLIATAIPELSFNGGTSYYQTFWQDPTTGNISISLARTSGAAAVARSFVLFPGATHARVRLSAFTSGTENVVLRATDASLSVDLNEGVPGQPVPPTAQQMGGKDGSGNLRAFLVDTSGRQAAQIFDASGNQMPSMDVVARKGFQAVTDGVNVAAVKAASTAALASDTALVVALSPNNQATVVGTAAAGAAASGNPLLAGGTDGSFARSLLVDTSGRLVTTAKSSTATASSVAASTSASVTILAANTARLGVTIYNDSASATMYVACGPTCTTTSFKHQLPPMSYMEIPFGHTGIITGTWSAAVGNARIEEHV